MEAEACERAHRMPPPSVSSSSSAHSTGRTALDSNRTSTHAASSYSWSLSEMLQKYSTKQVGAIFFFSFPLLFICSSFSMSAVCMSSIPVACFLCCFVLEVYILSNTEKYKMHGNRNSKDACVVLNRSRSLTHHN